MVLIPGGEIEKERTPRDQLATLRIQKEGGQRVRNESTEVRRGDGDPFAHSSVGGRRKYTWSRLLTRQVGAQNQTPHTMRHDVDLGRIYIADRSAEGVSKIFNRRLACKCARPEEHNLHALALKPGLQLAKVVNRGEIVALTEKVISVH